MNLRSFIAIFLTLFGTILIILTIYLGVKFNNELREKVKCQKELQIELDASIEELEQTIVDLTEGPLAKIVAMEAMAVELVGRKTQDDNQLYDFSLWIDVPNNRKNDIERVEYRRGPGDKLQKVITGNQPTNGFSVSYTGWGCFHIVEVTIIEKSGKSTKMSFNQCDSIGWG
jgi:hypothetical protein